MILLLFVFLLCFHFYNVFFWYFRLIVIRLLLFFHIYILRGLILMDFMISGIIDVHDFDVIEGFDRICGSVKGKESDE